MARQPEIAPRDIVPEKSPAESPLVDPGLEDPGSSTPEIAPDQSDQDVLGGTPTEIPPPLD